MKNCRFTLRALVLVSSLAVLSGCQSPEEKVQAFVDKAVAQAAAGDYAAAHIEFSNALQINPNHIGGLFGVTEVFEHEQKWKQVHQYLKRVLELDPDHVPALHKVARLEVAGNQLDTALARSQRLKRLDPNSAELHALDALIELREQRPVLADAAARRAIAIDPTNEDAVLVIATLTLQAGKVDEALSIAERLQSHDSSAIDMFRVTAVEKTDDIERIAAVYRDVIAKHPDESLLSLRLAGFYADAGRIDDGRAVMLQALAQSPDNRELENQFLAYIQHMSGNQAMLDEVNQLIATTPDRLDLLNKKAIVLNRMNPAGDLNSQIESLLLSVAQQGGDSVDAHDAKIALASSAFSVADDDRGDGLIAEVLAADPEHQAALRIKASRMIEEGDADAGLTVLRALQADNPRDARVALAIARAHRMADRFDLAVDQYRRAAEINPRDPDMAVEYARLLKDRNQLAEADQVLVDSLSASIADNVRQWSLLADIRLARQDWIGAGQAGQQLQQVEGTEEAGQQVVALALVGQNRFDEGIASLQQIFEQSDAKARPMVALVNSYVRSGRGQQALDFLDSVLLKDPTNALAMIVKARSQRTLGLTQQAESSYRQYISNHPENPTAYAELSSLLVQTDRLAAGLAVLDQGLSRFDDDQSLLFRRSAVLTQLDRKAEAVEVLAALLESSPDFDAAANNLAVLLVEQTPWRDTQRALALAERFKRTQVPAFLDTLGWVNLQAGDVNNAIYFLESAAKGDPNDGAIRYHLSHAYIAANRNAAARAELARAQDDTRYADRPWFGTIKTTLESLQD